MGQVRWPSGVREHALEPRVGLELWCLGQLGQNLAGVLPSRRQGCRDILEPLNPTPGDNGGGREKSDSADLGSL